jgi:hypothetical protein
LKVWLFEKTVRFVGGRTLTIEEIKIGYLAYTHFQRAIIEITGMQRGRKNWLITRAVDEKDLENTVMELAESLAKRSTLAVSNKKVYQHRA